MLSLSPAKLLVILVIALIVLGPEKLPQVARQIGARWHDLREWRSRIESEVRGTFPNLPPTHEVAQAVRSPLAFLDRLADEHERAVEVRRRAGEPSSEAETDAIGPGPTGRCRRAATARSRATARCRRIGSGTMGRSGTTDPAAAHRPRRERRTPRASVPAPWGPAPSRWRPTTPA